MAEDQRFAAARPDVLVYQTPPLADNLTIAGPIHVVAARLDDRHRRRLGGQGGRCVSRGRLGAEGSLGRTARRLQQLVRGEPFRGKFRQSFERPVPVRARSAGRDRLDLPDVAHTSGAGTG